MCEQFVTSRPSTPLIPKKSALLGLGTLNGDLGNSLAAAKDKLNGLHIIGDLPERGRSTVGVTNNGDHVKSS